MKQKRYSEEQIVYALKQVAEVSRQLGVCEPTFYAHILQEVVSKGLMPAASEAGEGEHRIVYGERATSLRAESDPAVEFP